MVTGIRLIIFYKSLEKFENIEIKTELYNKIYRLSPLRKCVIHPFPSYCQILYVGVKWCVQEECMCTVFSSATVNGVTMLQSDSKRGRVL